MRSFIWLVLISSGVLAAMAGFFMLGAPAVAISIGVITTWISAGMVSSYFAGIRRHVVAHLGPGWRELQVVSHPIKHDERVDIQLTLDRLRDANRPKPAVFGISAGDAGRRIVRLIAANPAPDPMEWESLPCSPTEVQACAAHALYLLRYQGEPFCALVSRATDSRGRLGRPTLEILAHSSIAQPALRDLLQRAYDNSIYRGKVLSVQKGGRIAFHDMPAVNRDAIVLPAEVMDVVERSVLGMLKHAAALRRAGRSTRHGVLLHGPPGTGKTLVTKYLARACPDYTVLVVTGRHLNLIRETCQLARLLAPSLVILEDVDLIASDRRRNRRATVLHELMDEMDGLGPKSDCIFLLTSNRPELLEPALAARPGRIDQAIYFPLPDLECRRRLFAQLASGLDLTGADLGPLLLRTEGASPAFLAELFRKAALMAAERVEREGPDDAATARTQPLRVVNADFERALRELVEFGGALTRSLLAFAPPAAVKVDQDGSARPGAAPTPA